MARVVRLIPVDDDGAPLGALPDIDIEEPWWPEVGDIVTAARERLGLDLFVLRLVDAQGGTGMADGLVSYTAEAMGPTPPMLPAPEDLPYDEDPRRAPWARPGGIASIVAWADGALRERGAPRIGPVHQVKTWNLSSVLQLPTADGVVWCKTVPRFFAHEPAVVSLLARERAPIVPSVVAADEGRGSLLLEDLGPDVLWDADEETLTRMVRMLVALQVAWADRTDDLLAIGTPDHRSGGLASRLQTFLARGDVRATLRSDELGALDDLAADLPDRVATLAACGIPDSLVHGDFHPGNWIRRDGEPFLFDWGDSFVGHPLIDTGFLAAIEDEDVRTRVRAAWVDAWRAEMPGSDPAAAIGAIAPIVALWKAFAYRLFLDAIEPSEHRYHERDVPDWLRVALDARAPTR
jgi:hypothetical protein